MTEFGTQRPHCDACGVDMWLTRISGAPEGEAYRFECKVCGAHEVVRGGPHNMKSIEDGL